MGICRIRTRNSKNSYPDPESTTMVRNVQILFYQAAVLASIPTWSSLCESQNGLTSARPARSLRNSDQSSEVSVWRDRDSPSSSNKTICWCTLLEKQSKFPRYNIKCRVKPDTSTTWNIPRSITFFPLHFMLYRGKSLSFGTVYTYSLMAWWWDCFF